MQAFLLDTDTCIYALKQKHGVLEQMLARPRAAIHVSVVTEAELRVGAAKSASPTKTARLVENFLAPLQRLPFESDDAIAYAKVRAALEKAGTPIGPLDTFLAAHALARRLTLVTNNHREFTRVHGLRIENWAHDEA
jgi:tRNA(fMet)-specific endonuclease VapC